MSPKDHNFDWVQARAKCSLAVQFERLKADVEKNVADRNSIVPEDKYLRFEMKKNDLFFRVLRTCASKTRWVTFQIPTPEVMGGTSELIKVLDDNDNEMFRITLTLSSGDCRYKIAEGDGLPEGEYLRWQVIQKALEPLFF